MKNLLLSLIYFLACIFSVQAQTLYGLTSGGGNEGVGTLIKFIPPSNNLSVDRSFEWYAKNPLHTNLIQATNGKLYGMTLWGGDAIIGTGYGGGAIFSFDPPTGNYTKLMNFDDTKGYWPYGSLVLASDGKLYGMTSAGGSGGYGVIFSFDPSTSTFTKLKDFDSTNGAGPRGSLMQANNGKLYGMTGSGGSSDAGVIFSYDPTTSTYTKLKDFDGTNGASPNGDLIQASNGKLYGMTQGGGSNIEGVIFSFDPSSSIYTMLKDLDYTDGVNPYGSLVQASNGKLYGMTNSGGAANNGVIFSYDPSTSTYTKLKNFFGTEGRSPFGNLIQASNGKLYGMTTIGGSSNGGVIFSFDPASSTYTKLKDFDSGINGVQPYGSLMQASNGKLYGMTYNGGSSATGVIFSYDPATPVYTKLMDFDDFNTGFGPSASLAQASNRKLYGMTNDGGSNGRGVIFSFDPYISMYTKLKDFDGNDGANPLGSLIQASNGKLYGMTQWGGSGNLGVIFSYDTSTSIYTKLMDFDLSNGAVPSGSLMQASDGKLYGMTGGGGNFYGVIFSFNPSTSIYTKLKDFDDTTGANPSGSLMQAANGQLYGMTPQGGSSNVGVIFSYNPSTSTYTKLNDFDGTNGAYPSGSLMQASNGKLYGMTNAGGSNDAGVIFSYDPSTSIYTKLKDFDSISVGSPYGNLMQASDGKLYGMTSGVIFSFDLSASTYTKLQDFDGTNGAGPGLGSAFIELIPGPLPVTLISFTGKNNGNSNHVYWKVENEQDLNYYELQRGIDGLHFNGIAQIKATGNNSYTYNDPIATSVSSTYYYRLKSVDKDGKFTYSSICIISFSVTGNTISISPNPVANLLRIETSSGEALVANSATADIHIYSSTMQLMRSIKIIRADRNVVTIPVDRLAKGVYFLQIINADEVRTVKFLKE